MDRRCTNFRMPSVGEYGRCAQYIAPKMALRNRVHTPTTTKRVTDLHNFTVCDGTCAGGYVNVI